MEMEYDYSLIEKRFADYLLNLIGPNENLDNEREKKFNIVKTILENSFYNEGIKPHIYSFGSYPTRTYLPESDMDMTILLEDKNTKKVIFISDQKKEQKYVLKIILG